MSEQDNNQDQNNNQNTNTQAQTVAISVEEYNQLQGKLRKYETDLAYSQKTIEDLKTESKNRRPKADDSKPDEQLKSLQDQLNNTTEQLNGYKGKLKTKTISEHFAQKIVSDFVPSAKDWILRDYRDWETDRKSVV